MLDSDPGTDPLSTCAQEKKQYEEYLRRRQEILGAVQSGRYQPAYAAPAGPYTMRPMYGGMYGPGYGYRRPYGYGMYPAGPLGYGSGIGMGRGPGAGLAVGGGLLGAFSVRQPGLKSDTYPFMLVRRWHGPRQSSVLAVPSPFHRVRL